MNRKTSRVITILLILFSTYLLFYPSLSFNYWYNPYDFGFLVHNSAQQYSTNWAEYIRTMHIFSPFYISFTKIMKEVLGIQTAWIRYPGGLILLVMMFSYIKKGSLRLRTLFILGALGGPVFHYLGIFNLRRDFIDLALIMLYLIFSVNISPRLKQTTKYYAAICVTTSITLWLTHYTIWPFLIGIMFLFPLFSNQFNGTRDLVSVYVTTLVGTSLAIYIKALPIQVYIQSIFFIQKVNPEFGLDWIQSSSRQVIQNPTIIPPLGQAQVSWWYPEFWYIGMLLLGSSLSIVFFIAWKRSTKAYIARFTDPEVAMFISAVISFIITAVSLISRGYFTRIFFLWPIMFVVFSAVGAKIVDGVGEFKIKQAVVILLIGILCVHGATLTQASNIDPTAEKSVRESTSFVSSYQEGVVYTDLKRANHILLESGPRNIKTPVVQQLPNGSIAIDEVGRLFYFPDEADGCILLASEDTIMTGWGGALPIHSEKIRSQGVSTVYSNGQEQMLCS